MDSDSVSVKATDYLVQFEQWSEQNDSGDIEKFLNLHSVAPNLADEIRDFLRLENNLFRRSAQTERKDLDGQRIGNYKILKQLGAGGMATVWLADQEKPVRRKVALKVLSAVAGSQSDSLARRLQKESQVLANLSHPNIAGVLDAGRIEEGVPFFVMEYIDGKSITDYCNEHYSPEKKDALANRLRLARQLCLAIQHIHQNSLLHRDIKPSNVMVTLVDGKPQVKVIDLGLAKVIRSVEPAGLETTDGIGVVGSPLWMSPEQVIAESDSSDLKIDTRSDIYSLGALLYELVTGTSPLEEFRNSSSKFELLKAVVESEFDRPSVRLAKLASRQADFGMPDQHSFPWANQLKRDLDWVIMKSLAKDRDLRYSSASELQQDIDRFLNSEPVLASPPTLFYNASKLISRNRGISAALFALITGLALTSIVSLYALADARSARDEAVAATAKMEDERRLTAQLRRFLEASSQNFGLLNVNNPGVENDIFKKQYLMQRKKQIDGMDLSSDPDKELTFRVDLAGCLQSGGFNTEAIEEYSRVSELSDSLFGAKSSKAIKAKIKYVNALVSMRRPDAKALVRQCANVLAENNSLDEECKILVRLAQETLEPYPDSEAIEGLITTIESRYGLDSKLFVQAKSLLAESHSRQDRVEESAKAFLAALEAAKRVYGDHRITMGLQLAYWRLAARLMATEETDRKEIEAFVSDVRNKFGKGHQFSLKAEEIEIAIKFRMKELADPVKTYADLINRFAESLGPDHPETIVVRHTAGTNLRKVRKLAEAIAHFNVCMPKFKEVYGPKSLEYLDLQRITANCHMHTRNGARKAIEIAEEFLLDAMKSLGRSHSITIKLREDLATCKGMQGDFAGFETLLKKCLEDAKDDRSRASILLRLSDGYVHELDNLDEAIKCLREAVSLRKNTLGELTADTIRAQGHFLSTLLRVGAFEEAERVAEELVGKVKRGTIYMDPIFFHARISQAECLVERQAFVEAVTAVEVMGEEEGYDEFIEKQRDRFNITSPLYSIIEQRSLAVLGRCQCAIENVDKGKRQIQSAIDQLKQINGEVNFPRTNGLDWYRESLTESLMQIEKQPTGQTAE